MELPVQDMPVPSTVTEGVFLYKEPSGVHNITVHLFGGGIDVAEVRPVARTANGKYIWGILPAQFRKPDVHVAQLIAWPPPEGAPAGFKGSCPVCGMGEVTRRRMWHMRGEILSVLP